MPTQRNGEIELWRFIVAVIIVAFHSKSLFSEPLIASCGRIGVEFFFLLSGYLLAATAIKHRNMACSATWEQINQDSYSLLIRRIRAIFPECLISCLIAVLVYVPFSSVLSLGFLISCFLTLFSNAFMLKMTGLFDFGAGVHGATWYLSTLLLMTALLYPLMRRWGVSTIMGVIGLFALGTLYVTEKEYDYLGCFHRLDVVLSCNIRGFGEMLLGASLFPVVQWLRRGTPTKTAIYLLTPLKWCCGGALIMYAQFWAVLGHNVGVIICLMCVMIVLMFWGKCFDCGWYQNGICLFLGRFSLPLFLSNAFYAHVLGKHLPADMSSVEKLLLYFVASFTTAFIVMILARMMRSLPPLFIFEKQHKEN